MKSNYLSLYQQLRGIPHPPPMICVILCRELLRLQGVSLHPRKNPSRIPFPTKGSFMADPKQLERAERVFQREKREAEINEALKHEAARHDAAIKNMHRLKALRLARDQEHR
jgi:hypothetical protein